MSGQLLGGVPALTLRNPWARAITHHGKDVENRSWMPHDGVHSLMVHAGKGWDRWPDSVPQVPAEEVATSAIVAVADLAWACNTSRYRDRVVCRCGPWAVAGQCHWRLRNVVVLAEPVPCDGAQGLWRPGSALVEAVAGQLIRIREEVSGG